MNHEMKLEVQALMENLSSGREDLVGAADLEDFALTPGNSSCNGHGNSSCSSTPAELS